MKGPKLKISSELRINDHSKESKAFLKSINKRDTREFVYIREFHDVAQ